MEKYFVEVRSPYDDQFAYFGTFKEVKQKYMEYNRTVLVNVDNPDDKYLRYIKGDPENKYIHSITLNHLAYQFGFLDVIPNIYEAKIMKSSSGIISDYALLKIINFDSTISFLNKIRESGTLSLSKLIWSIENGIFTDKDVIDHFDMNSFVRFMIFSAIVYHCDFHPRNVVLS